MTGRYVTAIQPRIARATGVAIVATSLTCLLTTSAQAQNARRTDNNVPRFAPGMIDHMQNMRRFPDPDRGATVPPKVIPRLDVDDDPTGKIGTFQPNGSTITSQNAFFQDLGTNGRTCFTCHQPANAWGVSAASVQARFASSNGQDPIFRLVDGATCPTDDVSTPQAMQQAYQLVLSKALIRIGLPMPANAQFSVTNVQDPYGCNTNPQTGLTKPTT